MAQPNVEVANENSAENIFAMESFTTPPVIPDAPIETLETAETALEPTSASIAESKIDEQLENAINSIIQQDPDMICSTDEIMSIETPIAMEINENSVSESLNQAITSLEEPSVQVDFSSPMDISTELPATVVSGNSTPNKTQALISPTTPSVAKERKRRIIIDDDDESPTFNPLRSTKKMRGKNRRKNLMLKKQQHKAQLLLTSSTDKPNEAAVFTSPEAIVSTVHFFFVYLFIHSRRIKSFFFHLSHTQNLSL